MDDDDLKHGRQDDGSADRSRRTDQAHRAFGGRNESGAARGGNGGGDEGADDSAQRFRETHPHDTFEGASGVLFEQAMAQTRMAICLSDPHADDQPIVFANRAFRELTGYPEDEIVGRNCRFLQGPDTDPDKVSRIRNALADEDVIVVELLNYRKDGTPFWNALHIGPIYGSDGKLVYFFGSQWDVTDVHAARADEKHAKLMSRELSHRMKNMFSVIGGIVSVTGRTRGFGNEAREINERIQALGRAYETTLDDAGRGSIDVGEAMRAVLRPYDPDGDRIAIRTDRLRALPNTVSSLGLTLHELATNAIKHGALSVEGGTVDVFAEEGSDTGDGTAAEGEAGGSGNEQGNTLIIRWQERDGPPVTPPDGTRGTGIGIVDTLLQAADGELQRDWDAGGLRATVRLPGLRS